MNWWSIFPYETTPWEAEPPSPFHVIWLLSNRICVRAFCASFFSTVLGVMGVASILKLGNGWLELPMLPRASLIYQLTLLFSSLSYCSLMSVSCLICRFRCIPPRGKSCTGLFLHDSYPVFSRLKGRGILGGPDVILGVFLPMKTVAFSSLTGDIWLPISKSFIGEKDMSKSLDGENDWSADAYFMQSINE